MFLVTESGKRILRYEILSTENEEVSHFGIGYDILKTNNNQKFQVEGVRRRNNFASFIKVDDLEAGAEADFLKSKLIERFQVVLSSIINSRLEGANLVSSCCEGVLCETKWWKCYQDRFEKTRILVWLEFTVFVVLMVTEIREAGASNVGVEYSDNETKWSSYCSEEVSSERIMIIRREKEYN
jgi:hypothetical protein